MTDPVPSKERIGQLLDYWSAKSKSHERWPEGQGLHAEAVGRIYADTIETLKEIVSLREDCRRWENAHKILLSENERLRQAMRGQTFVTESAPEPAADLLEASQRVSAIALGAAGKHAEKVVELEAEVSTLREHLAEQNRLLSLNVAEVERLRAAQPPGADQG